MVAVSFEGSVFLAAREYLVMEEVSTADAFLTADGRVTLRVREAIRDTMTRIGSVTTTRPERSVSVASSQSNGIEPPLRTNFPRRILTDPPYTEPSFVSTPASRASVERVMPPPTPQFDVEGNLRYILPDPVNGLRYRMFEKQIVSVLAQGGTHALVEFAGGQRRWVANKELEEPFEVERKSALDRLLEDE